MRRVALCLILLPALVLSASAETYVVHPDGTGDFPTIQAAIDAVVDGDIIELTDGTFTGDGNRDIDFLGKAITVRSQSGNPEACAIDCEGSGADPHRGFNFLSGEESESALEGVTVTHGHAPGAWPDDSGGAILCREGSSPTFTRCKFCGNSASFGGGIFCEQDCHPTFTYCTISSNSAVTAGGMYCLRYCSPTLANCTFTGNSAGMYAGAIACNTHCSPLLTSCTFSGNSASRGGGGITCTYQSSPTLTNCTFSGNSASEGAGLHLRWSSTPTMENSIIAFSFGGEAVFCQYGGGATLTCCDVYGNAGGDWVGCIADQYGVNGNISEDPLFCDSGAGDLTLQDCSPCAPFSPPNPECDLIGAWPVGCGGTPITRSTWGGVKVLFRD